MTEYMLNPAKKAELLARHTAFGFTDLLSEKALLDLIAQATVADVQVPQIFIQIEKSNGNISPPPIH